MEKIVSPWLYFYKIYKRCRTWCIITRIQYCNTLFFTLENGRQYRFLYIKQFTCNKSRYLTNPGFFFLSMGKKVWIYMYKCIEWKINKGYLQGEQTLVQTIACVGYCEHKFERSGSISILTYMLHVTDWWQIAFNTRNKDNAWAMCTQNDE